MSDAPKETDSGEEPSPSQPAFEVATRGPREVEDEGSRKRLLLVIPLVMAAAAIVGIVLAGMEDKGMYSKPVDQLLAEKSKFLGKPVRAEGSLVHGSLEKRESPCEYRFKIEKNGTEVPVRFAKCVVPDTFRDVPNMDVGVTVEGELQKDDSIEATAVLAKCPSKYEMKQKAASGEKAPHAMGAPPAPPAEKPPAY